ncbi:uncharacterized protein C11orf42-like isoform X2 [Mercenaria mercenaria]|uniref:uncharacterized protein C11orf42-like isoform X2 n=1 Tax=Mercenaria mercenaria TaxID=6596 RepID=UPI00234EE17E|nr:uncharacterized protein C11orf42-like isoform X2 [Mercenaria mercenaria]
MDSKLFKKLETCNAEQNWENVRDVVAVQLLGGNIFPVPFLREATHFDIGHVMLKGKRTRMEKLTGVMTSSLPVGQLSQFVTVDPDRDLMQRLGNVRKEQELKLNQAYEFHESDMKHGVKKTLTVQLWGCEKWAMEFAPKPGELVVDFLKNGYKNIDRIYLITEVFYVSDAKIHVSIGNEEDEYLIKGQIPIGFSLVRYNLLPDGTLGPCKKKKPGSWCARWIRHLARDKNDPFPFDPFQAHGVINGDNSKAKESKV